MEEGLDRSLFDLGLTYVDEYLMHFPIALQYVPMTKKYPPEWFNLEKNIVLVPHSLSATWKSMEELVDKGKCKKIGLSNFVSVSQIQQILETCRYSPSALQLEIHPQNTEDRLISFARENGIRVEGSLDQY